VQVTAVPVQTPAWQVSPVVQALPSVHVVPFVITGLEQTPVDGSHVPATWHWSLAVQVTVVPPQRPAWQVSPVVQALPSLHDVPFVAAGFEHTPVEGLHVPATWHWSLAVQVTAVPVHVPAWQLSPVVHASPSVHDVPFVAFGFEQRPVAGLHVPATWHWSLAVQVTAVPPQTPAWQLSPVVHRAPSLHVVPSVAFGFEQTPVEGSQTPATWHWSLAVQVTAVPGEQTPA
jgi:hypothetical protein